MIAWERKERRVDYLRALTLEDLHCIKSSNIAKNLPKHLIAAFPFGRNTEADEQ